MMSTNSSAVTKYSGLAAQLEQVCELSEGEIQRQLGRRADAEWVDARERRQAHWKREQARAMYQVAKAVREGRLVDLSRVWCMCSECDERWSTLYHHHDYREPLNVRPVCHRCNLVELGSARGTFKHDSDWTQEGGWFGREDALDAEDWIDPYHYW